MTGVVMLLTGPLQSWGGPAPGVYDRPTDAMPSLSAVVGIIANALGRQRTDTIDDLASGAGFAVRADRPGVLLTDFHTVGTENRYALAADTGRQLKNPVVSQRQYLSDAAFLAVYEPPKFGISPDEVFSALLSPARPLYLGRRSCPPAERIPVCVTDKPAHEVLERAALLRDFDSRQATQPVRSDVDFYHSADGIDSAGQGVTTAVLIEATAPADADPLSVFMRQDVPQTFDMRRLYHLDRPVIGETLQVPVASCVGRGSEGVAALYASLGVSP